MKVCNSNVNFEEILWKSFFTCDIIYVSHVRYFSSHVEFYVIECDMYGFNPHVGKKSK